jgi:hypothetical protein
MGQPFFLQIMLDGVMRVVSLNLLMGSIERTGHDIDSTGKMTESR